MLRLVVYLLGVTALAFGLSWLADRPGSLVVQWQGYEVETSVFRAIVILAVLLGLTLVLWSVLRQIWNSPAAIGHFFNRRRQKRGLEALSSGMIAIGAGDRASATRYAIQARKSLPNEPLTHLLRAQAAQLSGDRATSRRIFEAMLSAPDTEQLGLRGLFLEAEREGEREAARQFAERAMTLNPQLAWPTDALFDLQCKEGNWEGALQTLAVARRNNHMERAAADRKRAVLLTAQAQTLEDNAPDQAMALALEAHGLAPDLVPAGAISGRILAAKGNTSKAAKVLQRTWKLSPHPDIATAYAYARIGDSPRDRLARVRHLASLRPHSIESAIAVAGAAIEAHDWPAARSFLQPLLEAPTQRVCTLMAKIEAEQHGDKGRVREWLARAVNAARDPAWTADGIVADHWAPVSPVTGALDAFKWRVPVEEMDTQDAAQVTAKLEELVALGADHADVVIDAPAVADETPVADAAPEPEVATVTVKPAAPEKSVDAEVVETVPAPAQPEPAPAPKAEPVASAEPEKPVVTTTQPAPQPEPAKAAPPAPAPVGAAAVAPESKDRVAAEKPKPEVTEKPLQMSSEVPATSAQSTTASPTISRPVRRPGRPLETKIFVPPRAPDDPGPEEAADDGRAQAVAYQFPLKGSA